jgi:hypothetical protein
MFSLGVILFILVVGYPPFNLAVEEDVHYASIINSNFNRFWDTHQKLREHHNIDPDF